MFLNDNLFESLSARQDIALCRRQFAFVALLSVGLSTIAGVRDKLGAGITVRLV